MHYVHTFHQWMGTSDGLHVVFIFRGLGGWSSHGLEWVWNGVFWLFEMLFGRLLLQFVFIIELCKSSFGKTERSRLSCAHDKGKQVNAICSKQSWLCHLYYIIFICTCYCYTSYIKLKKCFQGTVGWGGALVVATCSLRETVMTCANSHDIPWKIWAIWTAAGLAT